MRDTIENAFAWARDRPWPEIGRFTLRWLERVAFVLLLWVGLEFVLIYGQIAAATLSYPYHLEWMEGGVVETVARVTDGEPIYGAPTIEYVPYIYTPFYFWVCSLFGSVFGVDFFACRLVSLLSVFGLAGLLWRWIHRETGSWFWGIVAIALWCATYDASGRWFHLARVDTFGLLLMVGGLYVLRFYGGWRSALVAGWLLFLAFLTKQSSLIAIAPVLIVMVGTDFRRSMIAGTLLTALFGISIAIGMWATDGWWWFWIFELARAHDDVEGMEDFYWRGDLWRIAIIMGLGVIGAFSTTRTNARAGLFLVAMLLGATVMSYLSRMHSGGFLNVLMPVHFVAVLCAGIGCARLSADLGGEERSRLGGSASTMGLCLALIFQFDALTYPGQVCIPAPDAVEAGEAFEAEVAAIEGEVLVPDHRWVQTRVGKSMYGLGMAGRDLFRMNEPDHPARLVLLAELEAALAEHRFAAVITSVGDSAPGLREHYRADREIRSPLPVTGWQIRPWQVWVPKDD